METYEAGFRDGSTSPVIAQPDDNKTLWVLKLTEVNERICSTFYSLDEQDPQGSTDFVEKIKNHILSILSLLKHRTSPFSVPSQETADKLGKCVFVPKSYHILISEIETNKTSRSRDKMDWWDANANEENLPSKMK